MRLAWIPLLALSARAHAAPWWMPPSPEGVDESRLVLDADASVGMLGKVPAVGSTLALRYRPVELGFHVLDLSRNSEDKNLVGLGVVLLGRIPLGRSRADAILGASATAVLGNRSTNPDFDGLYSAFTGIAYQTPWRLGGMAQPFVQLRLGAARGTQLAPHALPALELHIGLSSPERR